MPRPEPTPHDRTARAFLDAAAELIDAALADHARDRPARLKSLKFPAALDWIRVGDVVELARRRRVEGSISKKAFTNRWPTKDAFLRDAIVHCLLYRDNPTQDPRALAEADALVGSQARSFSGEIVSTADGLLTGLLDHPRSFLLAHIGPMLDQHPDLRREVQLAARDSLRDWAIGYSTVLQSAGLTFRPGWTIDRVALALQAMVDGFVLRHRIDATLMNQSRWGTASLFADAVVAFVAGALDTQASGLSTHAWLDQAVTGPIGQRSVQ